MINVHFPSLSLKDSLAILLMFDLDISWIATMVNMKLGTITDPEVCSYCQNSGESFKNAREIMSVLSLWLPHSRIPAPISPLHANDGSLFNMKPPLGAPCGPQDNNPGS